MGLVLKERIDHAAEFALWKIEEADEFYTGKLVLSDSERDFIKKIRHPRQKKRWLASRYLLKYLMQTNAFVELLADEHGKPYITNFNLHVSISHSDNFAAVIISDKHVVGIDVEESTRNITPLRNKFLSHKELEHLEEANEKKQLLIYWAAKEVMYKMYGKRKLEFKDDMYIKPFPLRAEGYLGGVLMKNESVLNYNLHYRQNDTFTLVAGAHADEQKLV